MSAAAGVRTLPRTRLPRVAAAPVLLLVIVLVLLAFQAANTRAWGAFELQTLFTSTLPLAFLAVAQTVVVIRGGIDLSVGAQLVLWNCVAARAMDGSGTAGVIGAAVLVLAAAATAGLLTGWLTSRSGMPDIIVTLATSFIWLGAALFVMPTPGGGAPAGFTALVLGSGSAFWPGLLVLVAPILLLWWPLRRRRPGLSMYALGGNPQAAFLAGVDATRTRLWSYGLAGLFTALAGLATTAYTGGGQADMTVASTSTLASVAAVVLGGVALTGGSGGVAGPVIATWVLFLVPADLLIVGVDPSYGEVIKGVILVAIVMVGSLTRWAGARP